MSLPTVSVQLYSVHEQLVQDLDGTLGRLRDIGLTSVEAFDFVGHADRLVAELERHELRATTGHAMLVEESSDQVAVLPWDATFRAAQTLGIEYVIDPFAHPDRWLSREGIAKIADRLNGAAKAAADYGLKVGYHNHGHELTLKVDGQPGLHVLAELLDESVALEIDLYWAHSGEADIVELVNALGSRVKAVHVKDGVSKADTMALRVPDGQTAAGEGIVPLGAALDVADHLEYAVIEFDKVDGDIFGAIQRSYAFLTERGLK